MASFDGPGRSGTSPPVTSYDDLVAGADHLFESGDFKHASIEYGKALVVDGPRDLYCRHRRGVAARRVAEQRLDNADQKPSERRSFLDQAARWLSKSEAYLQSALEGADDRDRVQILRDQADTEETVARFLRLCDGNPDRRLSEAQRYRDEALQLQT